MKASEALKQFKNIDNVFVYSKIHPEQGEYFKATKKSTLEHLLTWDQATPFDDLNIKIDGRTMYID